MDSMSRPTGVCKSCGSAAGAGLDGRCAWCGRRMTDAWTPTGALEASTGGSNAGEPAAVAHSDRPALSAADPASGESKKARRKAAKKADKAADKAAGKTDAEKAAKKAAKRSAKSAARARKKSGR